MTYDKIEEEMGMGIGRWCYIKEGLPTREGKGDKRGHLALSHDMGRSTS